MIEIILEFICSKRFYLPIIFIGVGVIVYSIIANSINKFNKVKLSKGGVRAEKKRATVISIIKNLIKYFIAIIVILAILNVYGVNTTSIIASLGIAGVIIGLAFQDIAKDFLAGIFTVFDDAYSVGDTIKIKDFTGEVISIGLKDTKIKAYTGEIMTISNSAFTEVINYSAANAKVIVDINVSYDTNIEKLEKILESIKPDIKDIENVIGEPELLGVSELSDSSVKYSIVIDCKPMTYFGVKRETLKLLKNTLDKHKVEIPYNKLDIYVKEKGQTK